MKNFQTHLRTSTMLAVLALALASCGKSSENATTAAAQPSADGKAIPLPAAIKLAEAAAAKADTNATPDGNTLRLQGTMEVDAGKGKLAMRSMATVIDAKLGEKTAARLGTSEGQQALGKANASVQAPGNGVKPQVSSSDMQELANSMAGRTMYSSEAMHVGMIKAYVVTLDAKSEGRSGPRMQLNLTLSEKDMTLTAASAEFYPDGGKSFESYKKKLPISDVTIEKMERKDDKTLALSGSFKTADLPAGVLAKSLKGQTLAALSGNFDFQEVNIRSMEGGGGKKQDAKK
jgi:hypothetical protein